MFPVFCIVHTPPAAPPDPLVAFRVPCSVFCVLSGGLLDELRIVQESPTIVYCDSASAIFVAEDSASVKRSVWIHRRAAVLREMVDMGEVKFVKVHEKDNCADGLTKPIKTATLAHHLGHILPHFNYVRVA